MMRTVPITTIVAVVVSCGLCVYHLPGLEEDKGEEGTETGPMTGTMSEDVSDFILGEPAESLRSSGRTSRDAAGAEHAQGG